MAISSGLCWQKRSRLLLLPVWRQRQSPTGLRLLKPLTATLPRADELSVDARVLLCSLLLGIIAARFLGVFPALRSAQPAQAAGMRSRTSSRSQGTLVAGEVVLAFVLLVGAGLLIRTFLPSGQPTSVTIRITF